MKKYAPLYVIVGASLWGVDGVVLRPALYNLPVSLVVFIESGLITLLLSVFLLRSRKKICSLDRRTWSILLAVSLFGGVVGTMAITRALFYVDFINLSIVILIQKLQPVFTLLLAALILKERLPGKFFIWGLIAIAGTYIMTFGNQQPVLDFGNETFMATFLALIAAISFSLATVLSKQVLARVDFKIATHLRFTLTFLMMTIIILARGEINTVSQISGDQILVFFTIAMITGGPGIFLYYYGLKEISASLATICELAFPLTAIVLEFVIRGQILGPVQWIGVILLLISMLKVTRIDLKRI